MEIVFGKQQIQRLPVGGLERDKQDLKQIHYHLLRMPALPQINIRDQPLLQQHLQPRHQLGRLQLSLQNLFQTVLPRHLRLTATKEIATSKLHVSPGVAVVRSVPI